MEVEQTLAERMARQARLERAREEWQRQKHIIAAVKAARKARHAIERARRAAEDEAAEAKYYPQEIQPDSVAYVAAEVQEAAIAVLAACSAVEQVARAYGLDDPALYDDLLLV